MAIKSQETFVRATVTGPATADGFVRAFRDVPGDAIVQEIEIQNDYTERDPFPVSFAASVEWVQQ